MSIPIPSPLLSLVLLASPYAAEKRAGKKKKKKKKETPKAISLSQSPQGLQARK
jgi:hypothetical protein